MRWGRAGEGRRPSVRWRGGEWLTERRGFAEEKSQADKRKEQDWIALLALAVLLSPRTRTSLLQASPSPGPLLLLDHQRHL